MRTQDTFLHTSNCVAHVKTAAIFIPAGMEITAVLYFLRNGAKLLFLGSIGSVSEADPFKHHRRKRHLHPDRGEGVWC